MKLMKKTAAVLIAVLIVFSSLNFAVLAETGWDGVSEDPCTEGRGDPDNPYLISTPEQLAWFRTQVNTVDQYLCAKLTADIDLNNQEWIPIGKPASATAPTSLVKDGQIAYRGTFDGDYHTVKGFKIDRATDSNTYRYFGFFGAATSKGEDDNDAVIKNLTVKGYITIDASAKAGAYFGGICGAGGYLTVINCTSDVDILVTGKPGAGAGGIVGFGISTLTIEKCINLGNIQASATSVGGIIGQGGNTNSIINLCCNLGDVNGDSKVGGLVGVTSGKVTNCYNTGNISANKEDKNTAGSGGLIGGNSGSNSLTVSNCFNTGSFSSNYENYTGGIYGRMSGGNTTVIKFENVYYLEGICPRTQGILGRYSGGEYDLNQKTAVEIASTDFVDLLNLNAGSTVFKKGSTHPIFVWQKEESAPVGTKGDIDGNGTVNATDVSELISRIANDNVPDNAVADMNSDGTVNATDVSELISVIAAE